MARRVANLVVALAAAAAAECEVLRSLEFQQHTAPKGVNAQTASAATARASLTPPRPAPKVVSYPSLAPDQVEKAAYRSPFDSPTI